MGVIKINGSAMQVHNSFTCERPSNWNEGYLMMSKMRSKYDDDDKWFRVNVGHGSQQTINTASMEITDESGTVLNRIDIRADGTSYLNNGAEKIMTDKDLYFTGTESFSYSNYYAVIGNITGDGKSLQLCLPFHKKFRKNASISFSSLELLPRGAKGYVDGLYAGNNLKLNTGYKLNSSIYNPELNMFSIEIVKTNGTAFTNVDNNTPLTITVLSCKGTITSNN